MSEHNCEEHYYDIWDYGLTVCMICGYIQEEGGDRA